jgi:hypothetical protein
MRADTARELYEGGNTEAMGSNSYDKERRSALFLVEVVPQLPTALPAEVDRPLFTPRSGLSAR